MTLHKCKPEKIKVCVLFEYLLISVPGGSDRRAVLEPPRLCLRYLPQDKEGCGSDTSHEENACIFEESHTLHSNQQGGQVTHNVYTIFSQPT
ncbi:hypothetical protein ABN702_12945 [Bacillus haimaensis]|uniref:hypothetical protein n=1 Tax=Bacillus haimaensis TaxID=3160967 RepID=UPI003AA83BF7